MIDISDPGAAHTVGVEYLSSTAREVAVAGSFAYVAEYDLLCVIDIVDLSNPFLPQLLGGLDTPGLE